MSSRTALSIVGWVLFVGCSSAGTDVPADDGSGAAGASGATGVAGKSGSAGQSTGGQAGAPAAGAGGTGAGQAGVGASAGTGGAGVGGMGGSSGATSAGSSGASGQAAGGTGVAGSAQAGAAGSTQAGAAGSTQAGAAGAAGAPAGAGGASAGQSGAGGACVSDTIAATLTKKPIDIVIVIDNSGSMGNDIIGVQDNINNNFADLIGASGLDYRVILISKHGAAVPDEAVCISKPLSGADCSPTVPAMPANTSKFFHYSMTVLSNNSLSVILKTFAAPDEFNLAPMGWSQWLRTDAFKVFLEVTDDNAGDDYLTFDSKLLALPGGQFGTAVDRNYVFHAIIGVAENNPATAPWLPADPLVNDTCGIEAENTGDQYQELAKFTGGLRLPICDKSKFDAVFKTIAGGVVDSASIACAFPIPASPPGKTIDPDTIVVNYTPGAGGPPSTYKQVKDATMCNASSFYVASGSVHLCPLLCASVQNDIKAKVSLEYGCGKF